MLKMVTESLDGLPEAVAALYSKGDDGKYRLGLEGYEDPVGLKSALDKERTARKEFEKKARIADEFEGLDPKQVRELLAKFNDDERSKLIKEGKWEEALNLHTDKMRKDFQKQIEGWEAKVKASEEKAQRWLTRALDSSLREAASKVGLHPYAIEDALYRGRQLFAIDDEGNAVQLKDGAVVMGKDGKTPFSPSEWLESMREVAPHWFPATGQGGAAPHSSTRPPGSNAVMKRADFDRLSPAQRAKAVKEVTIVD